MTTTSESTSRPNHLIHEKSPYLLQHAQNPVEWYPWGDEPFERAAREGKPVFLSIGYSTCHWCHVMEKESFEDPAIAALLNRWFICVKVDREEHPDVDHIYMRAVTALTGHGGWPLTVFLTPERKPFFGGTYFPPERRWQTAGMKELLPAIAEAWERRRDELASSAEELTAALRDHLAQAVQPGTIGPELLDAAFNQAAAGFDPVHGGFGDAPKFPRSHELSLLLRYWSRTGAAQALDMVTATLDHLARGGIHDQLGGGFHRYATDAEWLVPHFEKMLYDQALLSRTYLEAYRITKQRAFADVARGIFDYVLRDLTDSGGGFYSAEDADSEGEEGKCYVWTPEEVIRALGPGDGELFNRFYGVTAEGNFEHGTSILHIEQPVEEFARLKGLEASDLSRRLDLARPKLLEVRARRPRPHRDEKILTSWNGLMIGSLASGGAALREPRYLDAARRAAEFVLASLRKDGVLLRRYRDGDARYRATLEDYAFLIDGLLELYEATFDPRWLSEAKVLTAQMIERHVDAQGVGFFLRGNDEERLIVQSKDFDDGATPSGTSMAVGVLLRLGRLTADAQLEALARRTLDGVAGALERAPLAYPQLLIAVDFALGPTTEIVIAGDPSAPGTQEMIRAVQERFLPRAVTVLHPDGPAGAAIEALAPYVQAQRMQGGEPTAYVCEHHVCRLPVTDVPALEAQLEAAPSS
jgi:uncharacterized protein YyaL (SSP411 family)